jgi:hypothetical protein
MGARKGKIGEGPAGLACPEKPFDARDSLEGAPQKAQTSTVKSSLLQFDVHERRVKVYDFHWSPPHCPLAVQWFGLSQVCPIPLHFHVELMVGLHLDAATFGACTGDLLA